MTLPRPLVGLASRARGLALEDRLAAQHAAYALAGRAHMTRVPTPARVIGSTSRDARGRTSFRAVWESRASVDFVGWAMVGIQARPAAVEAKTHNGAAAWSLSSVLPQQADVLDAYLPTMGYVLVILDHRGEVWALDWRRCREFARFAGRQTIRDGELGEVGWRCGLGVDWMEVIA